MPRKRYRLLLLVLGCLLAWFAGPKDVALADESTEFRKHYERALRLYDSGQIQESAKEFQAAYAIKQLPKLLLNLGQVHRRLGHAKEALAYYEFYLRVEPNPEPKLKVELDRYIAQTKAMVEAAQRAQQEATAHKGEPEDTPPPPRPELALTAPVPAESPAATPAVVTQRPAAVTPAPESTAPLVNRLPAQSTESDEPPRRPVYKRAWFWGVMGTVGAVVVGGVVTGVVLGTRHDAITGIEIRDWSLQVRP